MTAQSILDAMAEKVRMVDDKRDAFLGIALTGNRENDKEMPEVGMAVQGSTDRLIFALAFSGISCPDLAHVIFSAAELLEDWRAELFTAAEEDPSEGEEG